MIEKCSIGNMSYNLQNITLIILMLILIIVIIYYLKNSSTKHSEIIEKYTTASTAIDMSDTSSYNTHNAIANSLTNSEFPTAGTVVTLRDCQVKFNNDGTSKYEYKDGWQEIATLEGTPIEKKLISRNNETNQYDKNSSGRDIFVNYTEHSKCFKKMDGTTNKYKYQGNDLIKYTSNIHIELKVGANGVPENYMEMKFNLENSQEKINQYYTNLTNSICSLNYSNNLGGGNSGAGLGNLQLYRLTLNADNIITSVNQITINNTNNHIFTVSPTTNLAGLLTSSERTISYKYDYSIGNFRYKSVLNSGTQTNGTNNINVDIYTFNRELLCDKSQGEATYQTIKSYKITNDKQIDVNKIVSATSGDIDKQIPSTNFPGAASSYESKDQVLRAIENTIISDIASANTTTNQTIATAIANIGTKTSERDTFLDNINTKAKFFNKIFDTSTIEIIRNFLVSQSGLISNLELNKLGYSTADVTKSETILTTSEEPSFSIIKNNQPEDIYEIVEYKYDGSGDFTPYTKTFLADTICDILIVGGGGGGSAGHGGGGGAGQLVFIHQATLNGTYTIKVGKGGNGTILSGTSQAMGTITNGTKGSNSEFGNASINVIAEGGGISVDTTLRNGGSGAGGDGHTPDGGVGGKGLKNTTVDTFSSGTVYSRGNNGGDGSAATNGTVGQGGGGGGAGSAGTAGGLDTDSAIGHGGDGLSGISQINYDFKTNFGNYGKLESDGNYWFAGGGAGGTYYQYSPVVSNGGKGGGGSTPASVAYIKINGGDGLNGTGGGGAGGTAWYGNGGNGGSGIVILRYKKVPQLIENGNGKQITLTCNTNQFKSLTYDFSPYNDLTSWKNYANTNGIKYKIQWWNNDRIWEYSSEGAPKARHINSRGFVEFKLDNDYDYVIVEFSIPDASTIGVVNDTAYVKLFMYDNGSHKETEWNDNYNSENSTQIKGTWWHRDWKDKPLKFESSYTKNQSIRIVEYEAAISKNIKITLLKRRVEYRAVLPINTNVKINDTPITLTAGTYNIIMGASDSQIINRDTNVLKGTYPNIDGTKLTFKYEIKRTLGQLHNLQTTFSTIQVNSIIDNIKYSLGNKTNGIIKKYKIYIYKKYNINHNITIYAGDKQLTNGTDYESSGDSESGTKIINLDTYIITIKKDISGDIYFVSDKSIYYIDETSRNTFNNTGDTQFLTNVNNLIGNANLNNIFDITTYTTRETTARGQLITHSINSSLYPQAPLSISYNNSTLSANDPIRTSLNTLRTTYNNIHNYSPADAGALTSILNIHKFGNILNPVITDIKEYISYESATTKTPANRTTTFNILDNATKYVYFKQGVGE